MVLRINVREAQTHFPQLLAKTGEGQEIMITRAGRPVACLVPVVGGRMRRPKGNTAEDSPGLANVLPEFES